MLGRYHRLPVTQTRLSLGKGHTGIYHTVHYESNGMRRSRKRRLDQLNGYHACAVQRVAFPRIAVTGALDRLGNFRLVNGGSARQIVHRGNLLRAEHKLHNVPLHTVQRGGSSRNGVQLPVCFIIEIGNAGQLR